jgi:hypothetical protein
MVIPMQEDERLLTNNDENSINKFRDLTVYEKHNPKSNRTGTVTFI